MALRPNHVPSCWPPHFAVRTGHELLHARRLTFHILNRFLRIRHFPPYADHRFDSVLNTSTLCAVCRLLRSRHFAFVLRVDRSMLSTLEPSHRMEISPHSMLSVPRQRLDCSSPWLFPPDAGGRLLCLQHLTLRDGLRIAPYAITSRPRVVHGFLRAQHFKLRTGHRLLCVRRLALYSNCGSLRSPNFAPCAACGLLRRQHLEFCVESVVLRPRHLSLRPVRRLLGVRHLDQFVACCLRRTLHLVLLC